MSANLPVGDQPPGFDRQDLRARVLAALVLAPAALIATFAGPWLFAVFWAAAAIGVFVEWMRLVEGEPRAEVVLPAVITLSAATALMSFAPVWAVPVMALGALWVATFADPRRRAESAAGLGYAALVCLPITLLHADPVYGLVAVIFVFAVVWTSDVAAYFAGKLVGGPRLWPQVSPKKTWSGAVGGSLAATLAGVLVAAVAGVGELWAVAAVAFVATIVAQAGDLFESSMKRRSGVKDTSHIIPGHGGLMDRLDAFLAAAAFAAVIGLWRGGLAAPASGLLAW